MKSNQKELCTVPSKEQLEKIENIKMLGYTYDKQHSMAAAGVIFSKGNDFYFFGLEGEIMHNPKGLMIKV
jgi:hypothetical protein